MGDLEEFLHDRRGRTALLIKAGLAHVQFETIHPFLDGNGRVGRLLITLLLCAEGALREPLFYLSLYFKQHRDEYYERLSLVRTRSDWEGWLRFFLIGIRDTAQQAAGAAQRVLKLFAEDRGKIEHVGRRAGTVHRLHELLQKKPILNVPDAASHLELTPPTIRAAIRDMEQLDIIREVTGKQRDRVYVYDDYIKILDEGTEPI
jgi:Fic family protein